MKHVGDITKLNGAELTPVDVICGGSPCQDLSVAGKRAGLDGERSGLFMEQIRIIKEMRENDRAVRGADVDIRLLRPRYMVWENVPGAFSSNKGKDFHAVLQETAWIADENAVIPELDEGGRWTPSGCILGDGWSIAWRVHDAQFWGVPQRRKRIALVADFGGQSAPEILFESASVSGDSEQSGETGEGTSGNSQRSVDKTINPMCIGNGQLHDAMTPSEVCKTLNTMVDPMKVIAYAYDGTQTSPTLTANNAGGQQRMPDKENFNAVITYGIDRASFNQGKNAQYDFAVDEDLAQTLVSRGPGGGY